MTPQWKGAVRDEDPALELTRGTAILSEGIWTLVRRDAMLDNKSDSYILRRILVAAYGLPDTHIDPPRKRREKEKVAE